MRSRPPGEGMDRPAIRVGTIALLGIYGVISAALWHEVFHCLGPLLAGRECSIILGPGIWDARAYGEGTWGHWIVTPATLVLVVLVTSVTLLGLRWAARGRRTT